MNIFKNFTAVMDRQIERKRTDRYMARVEDHLATLADDDERHKFLKTELDKWMERYSAWALRVDTGTASEQDLSQSAFDYTETLAAIQARMNAFEKSKATA